jgi:rRNA maturation protein Nop10
MDNNDIDFDKYRREANKELYGTEDGHTFDPGDYDSKKCAVCGEKQRKH